MILNDVYAIWRLEWQEKIDLVHKGLLDGLRKTCPRPFPQFWRGITISCLWYKNETTWHQFKRIDHHREYLKNNYCFNLSNRKVEKVGVFYRKYRGSPRITTYRVYVFKNLPPLFTEEMDLFMYL